MAKILLIEDDLPLVRMYQLVLKKAGFDVVCALDGEEGIKCVIRDSVDLILLDMVMPKKDGFEVLRELKSDKKLAPIPVICLSVLQQEQDIERSKQLGADDYLVKTKVSPDEVVSLVRKHLKKSPKLKN